MITSITISESLSTWVRHLLIRVRTSKVCAVEPSKYSELPLLAGGKNPGNANEANMVSTIAEILRFSAF